MPAGRRIRDLPVEERLEDLKPEGLCLVVVVVVVEVVKLVDVVDDALRPDVDVVDGQRLLDLHQPIAQRKNFRHFGFSSFSFRSFSFQESLWSHKTSACVEISWKQSFCSILRARLGSLEQSRQWGNENSLEKNTQWGEIPQSSSPTDRLLFHVAAVAAVVAVARLSPPAADFKLRLVFLRRLFSHSPLSPTPPQ